MLNAKHFKPHNENVKYKSCNFKYYQADIPRPLEATNVICESGLPCDNSCGVLTLDTKFIQEVPYILVMKSNIEGYEPYDEKIFFRKSDNTSFI